MQEPFIFKKHREEVVPTLPCPLVIEDEQYYGRGVQRKLHTSAYFIKEAERTGFLVHIDNQRPREGERIPYQTETLAHLISHQWKRPLNEIVLQNGTTEYVTQKEKFENMYYAHKGVGWFDQWEQKVQTIAKQRKKNGLLIPRVREWHLIPHESLTEWLVCDRGIAKKMLAHNLVQTATRQPVNAWPEQNYIDNRSLAQLLAKAYRVTEEETFLPKEKDEFYQGLIREYLPERIEQFMREHTLEPLEKYTVREGAELTERLPARVRDNVTRGTIYSHKVGLTRYVQGIDLATWCLKQAGTFHLPSQDVCAMFGIPCHLFSELGIPSTFSGKLGTQRTVLPLFKSVVDEARTRVIIRAQR